MATETKIIEIKIDLLKGLEDIAKLQLAITNLEKAQKANTKASVEEKNEYAAKTVKLKEYRSQLNTLVKESANEIKTTIEKVGHIQKLKAEVSNLTLQYERLTKAELESTKGATVLNNLKSKREELSSLNQAYGNYSANVGNYSSATKMLGINLGQVMKEMPNFAISARIGIMSLTNNLPMLAESIKAVRLEQQAMVAAGQKAPSMFSLISKSVFGLTGLMSLLMVAMQLWGGDFINWIGKLITGNKTIDATTAKMTALKEIAKDGATNITQAYTAVNKAEIAFSEYNKGILTANEALNIYNKELGDQLGKQTDINVAMATFTQKAPAFIELQWKMALVAEFQKKGAEKYIEANIEKTKSDKDYATWYEKFAIFIANRQQYDDEYYAKKAPKRRKEGYDKAIGDANKFKAWEEKFQTEAIEFAKANDLQILNLVKDKNNTRRQQLVSDFDYEQKIMEIKAKSIEDGYRQEIELVNSNYEKKLDAGRDYLLKLAQQAKNGNKDAIKILDSEKKKQFEYEIALEEWKDNEILKVNVKYDGIRTKAQADSLANQIEMLKVHNKETYSDEKQTANDIYELNKHNIEIELISEELKNIKLKELKEKHLLEIAKLDEKYMDLAYKNKLDILKLELEEAEKIKDIRIRILEDEFNARKQIRDAEYKETEGTAKRTTAVILKYQKEEKDDSVELALLKIDAQKAWADTALNIASQVAQFTSAIGERELANYAKTIKGRSDYDELYAKKKVEIAIKQAILERSIASFGIIIDTAAAIMKLQVQPGFPAGIPLAVATGVMGAAQLATVWAQPLPSYESSSSSNSNSQKSTVTEKYHTGGDVGNKADSNLKSNEVTATLLRGERILSNQQSSVFNSILGNIKMLGGSENITKSVGINADAQMQVMEIAFTRALARQKAPILDYSQFTTFVNKQIKFEQNTRI